MNIQSNTSASQAKNKMYGALFGIAVGDAFGVPFEFRSKEDMLKNPATEMIGFGSHNQPMGTWSDDTSLTLCLADSLLGGYDLVDVSKKFIAWKEGKLWTAREEVFDIGITTAKSIGELKGIIESGQIGELNALKYRAREQDNGNGSLMRILPLLFEIKGLSPSEQFEKIWEISALTHKHVRAAMACFIYLKLAELILLGLAKEQAYAEMRNQVSKFWADSNFPESEIIHFKSTILHDIRSKSYIELRSSGYVIDSLETSLWCFMEKDNYKDIVLAIINLGEDTDTGAAIAGGLAGLYYGLEGIPEDWLLNLARYDDIKLLIEKMARRYLD
ncbi:ADP-ribosylglycohydrolase family protein [Sphingobacterium sp. ML3W]|uniref:ADP-ribosylglycohydrolase family protein n=1 Tax=Sphingobacterium sp. ML3W TaxID=1538644 RepID=UPI00249C32CA|nr:ADP-ribosylglycohydrolase family protein [Sphingobacterium sp. ML3W]WFA79488.1 ADP-ribosylglycohydrolase family protein [Sphingobacterium sp. ML3W]